MFQYKILFLFASPLLFLSLNPSFISPISSSFAVAQIDRTRNLSLFFSTLQCVSQTDNKIAPLREINENFDPQTHLSEYENPKDVERLIEYVNQSYRNPRMKDDPFTNAPRDISQLSLILNVLYPNWNKWDLWFNTTVWLVDRVNSAQLFWAVMVVAGEKFTDTIVTPSIVEVFPQLFINKREIEKATNMQFQEYPEEFHPLQYFTGDPGINEFHTNWHIDNPFWWNEWRYGVKRDRRGELFLYMHHQLLNRYQAELLSNGMPEVTPLQLDPDYEFPEPYYPDIVNINYRDFPIRRKGETMKDLDDGKTIQDLKTRYDRLNGGIEQGYFSKVNGTQESLQFDNATDILGQTVEASSTYSVNPDFYGSFHNSLHRFLGGMSKGWGPPGVEAHSETALRDPIFYRLHRLIDTLYQKLKEKAPAYTRQDLDYPGIEIKSVEIQTSRRERSFQWPSSTPTLTTYFTLDTYDIGNAARPCRGIGETRAFAKVKTLKHNPFSYVINLRSTRSTGFYGMMRIYLLPEYTYDGKKMDVEESHLKAIELDRFRIELDPNSELTITRFSGNSSVTRKGRSPGIKTLSEIKKGYGSARRKRACGFPGNLLIPKGNKDGLRFKLTVMITEEPEPEEGTEFPNFSYCGALNGFKYPDQRAMGFPFDRPGTKFVTYEGIWAFLGGYAYKNVKQIPVIIKHQEDGMS